jgi:phosphoribosylformimino-5-aminoimidazole carboxamide ribotide isomerase
MIRLFFYFLASHPRRVMDTIPVFDISNGHIVRGVGGDRATYRPVSIDGLETPSQIARHLYALTAAEACYVADLDALAGGQLQITVLQAIGQLPWQIWLDAGIKSVESYSEFRRHIDASIGRWIVALESLPATSVLEPLGSELGQRGIFSIDLIGGQLRTSIPEFRHADIRDVAAVAIDAGFRALLVLDVKQVGMRRGNNLHQVLRDLQRIWPDIELISGGGVRGRHDLKKLHQSGCQHALVATALYDGTIDQATIKETQSW